MFKKYYTPLAKNILFKSIPVADVEILLGCLSPIVKAFSKNEYIALSGDNVNYLGVVLSGSISLYKESYSGNNMLVGILKSGDIFAEALVFIEHAKYPVTIIATEQTEVMFIAKEKITSQCDKVCSFHSSIIRNLLEILSKKISMLNKKTEYLSIKSMRDKITAYLVDEYRKSGSPTLSLNMDRNELADFLNVSRPSMSREMGRMRDEGLIDFNKNNITILNLDKLKNIL